MTSLQIDKHSRREEDGLTGLDAVAGNDDLLTQILLRLPVRSLLRFKSVSKHWLSLISNPQFCVLSSKRSCKHISGLLLNPRYMDDSLTINFVPLDRGQPAPFEVIDFLDGVNFRRLESIQYCNSLLLCEFESTETKYCVMNPTTKQQHIAVSFPVKEYNVKGLERYSVALAFDPRKSPHFKLICLFRARPKGSDDLTADFCVKIYSSETGLMSQFSDFFRVSDGDIVSEGFYWNGAINWISNKSEGLYFNVDEERFGILPMPPAPQNEHGSCDREISYFGESNDHLYLVQTSISPDTRLDVYEMDREYFNWFVRFNVDLRPMFRAFPTTYKRLDGTYRIYECLHGPFRILAIVDRDGDEDSFIVFGTPGKAIRFQLKDGDFTEICDFYEDEGCVPQFHVYNWMESMQFIESLHPLD